MNARNRRRAGGIALAGFCMAAFVMAASADEIADSTVRPASKSNARAKDAGHVELERLKPPATPAAAAPAADAKQAAAPKPDVVNAFPSTSWYVPPPPAKPEPPPKPVAPPLPFSFMGRYEDVAKGSVVVMLIKGDRLYTVSQGDVIEDTYRVDRITDRTIELIYLPLHTRQALLIGGA